LPEGLRRVAHREGAIVNVDQYILGDTVTDSICQGCIDTGPGDSDYTAAAVVLNVGRLYWSAPTQVTLCRGCAYLVILEIQAALGR